MQTSYTSAKLSPVKVIDPTNVGMRSIHSANIPTDGRAAV